MSLTLNAIYSEDTVGEKNKTTPEASCYFATLQESGSYMENVFILFEVASTYSCLTEVTENFDNLFFFCLITSSPNLILTIITKNYRWILALKNLEIAIKSGLPVTNIRTSG